MHREINDLQSLLPAVVRLARQAGEAILEVYRSDFTVETKDDRTPLTAADRAAHELICAELAGLTPDIPVWSEESGGVAWDTRRHWREFWLVDPLDGTREFIRRNGEFTVNIALVRNHRACLGVVHAPALQRTYSGCLPGGAWRADGDDPAQPIRVTAEAHSPLRVAGSRSHRGTSLEGFLQRVGPCEFLSLGSSLKFCLVAEGAADVYPRLGPTSEWDTAAAQAVVEGAGGQVVDLSGVALRYNRGPEILNPNFVAFGDASPDWPSLLQA